MGGGMGGGMGGDPNYQNSNASPGQGEDASNSSKRRFVWTTDLHARFEAAVNALGLDHAKPKTILKLMNVDDLTKANIKSHLQKYRCSMQKKASSPSKPNGSAGVTGACLSAGGGADGAGLLTYKPPSDPTSGAGLNAAGSSASSVAGSFDGRGTGTLEGDAQLLGGMELPDPDKLMIEGETSLQRNLEVQEMTLKLQKELQEKLSTQLELQKNLQGEMESLMSQTSQGPAISTATNTKMTTILALKRKLQHELQAQLRMQHQLLSQLNQVVLPAVERLHTDTDANVLEDGTTNGTEAATTSSSDGATGVAEAEVLEVRPAQGAAGHANLAELVTDVTELASESVGDSAVDGEEEEDDDDGEEDDGEEDDEEDGMIETSEAKRRKTDA